MAEETMTPARKRPVGMLATLLICAVLALASLWFIPDFPHHAYLSGWLLFALMLILTFFNFRKKVPFLRMGKASFWLRMHICLGIFSGVLFFVHMGWSWPSGLFRQIFAWCFLIVFASGLVGWWMSRSFPKRLTVAGYETPFERMADARNKLRKQAEALVLANGEGKSPSLVAVRYADLFGSFFTKPCNFWAHLMESRSPQAAHASQFDEMQRYIEKSEQERFEELRELVARKHMLDYQYSLQLALRLWLFVHIPLSYSLLAFSVLHIILVHSFSAAVS
ncbi:hypothetical protein HZ994_17500 [Akkermansiaceae bacterium]|nr:hypothetical protein HZ994_17500 [Akkermansiaceae bacterium]